MNDISIVREDNSTIKEMAMTFLTAWFTLITLKALSVHFTQPTNIARKAMISKTAVSAITVRTVMTARLAHMLQKHEMPQMARTMHPI